MKIGIGVTTTSKRPHHKAYWENIALFTSLCQGMKVKIVSDIDGIAKAKNECIKALTDCDYVFLFDDDCFPIQEGWAQLFIDAHKSTGCHHFSYLHNYLHIRKSRQITDDVSEYSNSAGCMLFITKDVIDRVGAFNENFGVYGYEHVEYSIRCKLAGLAPHHNVCPDKAPEYIYSMDLDSWQKFDFNHYPTLSATDMNNAHDVSVEVYKSTVDNPEIYRPL